MSAPRSQQTQADGIACVAVRSPPKGASSTDQAAALPRGDQIFAFMPHSIGHPPAHFVGSQPQGPRPPSQELLSKLLVSLDSLKASQGGAAGDGSREASPSPLTVSAPGSAELDPSSPTDVAAFHMRSPAGALSREHSSDALAAAMQHLALGSRPGYAASPFQMMTAPGLLPAQTAWANSAPGNAAAAHGQGITSGCSTPYSMGPSTPMQMHSAIASLPQVAPHSAAQQWHGGCVAPPPQVRGHQGGAQDAASITAAYHALCLEQLAHQQRLHQQMVMAPYAMAYEECLVGLQGQYQPYCHQVITEELNHAARQMLSRLKALQLCDPPALGRLLGKRYFCSLKEVSKVVHSARMLLVAPDVRPSPTAHIKPTRLLHAVLASADAAGVPVVFTLSRRGIGQVFGRDKSMSIVAVMHIDQVEGEYVALLEAAGRGRELFKAHRCQAPCRY